MNDVQARGYRFRHNTAQLSHLICCLSLVSWASWCWPLTWLN